MYWFDSSFIILIPAIVMSMYAQYKVKSAFSKFSEVRTINGYTGAQVARALLDSQGIYNVPVEITSGRLTDHYDPTNRVMRLSQDVFYGTSVASIGVAAHETGHAIQHKEGYAALNLRNTIFPIVNFSSNASWIIFLIGMIVKSAGLINLGIILFSAVVLFQIITLPVEFNASKRALKLLRDRNIIYDNETVGAKAVLDAAALTYVAAALMAISQLVRLIFISRDRE